MTGDPIVIVGVRPVGLEGEVEFLGVLIRQFTPTDDNLVITSMERFPPSVPDPLHDPAGFVLSGGCSLAEREASYTEALWGIRLVGPAGGGWPAEEIEYSVGGRRYVLEMTVGMWVCGPSATDRLCRPPGSSDDGGD